MAMAMLRFYIQKGTHKGLYRSIARTLKFFQTFALVEVRQHHRGMSGISVTVVREVKVTFVILIAVCLLNCSLNRSSQEVIKTTEIVKKNIPQTSG